MLGITDLKVGVKIEYNNEPYQVITSRHVKMGRGGAIQQTKLKNLITGNVINQNFKGNDRFTEPDLAQTQAQFLYHEDQEFHFMDEGTYEQFSLNHKQLGLKASYIKEGASVTIVRFNDQPMTVEIPTKVVLEVKKAPPGVRGNTAQGGTKQVTLETGALLSVPLFIKEGDKIRVNTETGEYVERA